MSMEKLIDSFRLTSLGKAFLLLLIIIIPLAFPVQVQAAPDRCWTNKSQYQVGERITFGVQLGYTDVYYYLMVRKPDGSYTRHDVGYGPGTKYISGTAGLPAGQRTVQLRSQLGLHATCYFTVTGGGGGGTVGYVRVYVYVYAGLHDSYRYPLQGATVALGGASARTDGRGMVWFWVKPSSRLYGLSIYYQGRLLVHMDFYVTRSATYTFVCCLKCGECTLR